MSPAAESSAPLLPHHRRRGSSLYGAVFNVSTTIVGAGIMSIPVTIKVLGVIPAFLLILVVGWFVNTSVEFLMRFTFAGESSTYSGVMRESFGRVGSVAVQLCVMVTTLGCLIIYLIIIGDVLTGNEAGGSVHLGVLQKWFGFHWWNSRVFALLFILVFIMFPLGMFRRVESLGISSGVSVFFAVVFVGIASVLAISAILEGKSKNPRLLPQLDNQASFFQLFTAVPVIVTAFTFHFNVHPIGFELSKPTDMMTAVRISLVLCAAIYFTIGVFGYLLFGDSLMADILINFDRNSDSPVGSILNDVVRISYAFHLILVFPLMNFSLRANIDELLFPGKPVLAKDNTRFMSISIALLAFAYLAAIALPNIWYFFQFMGSTSAVCLAFIFPGAIVLRDVHGVSTSWDRTIATLMIVLAIVTSILAIFTNVYNLVGDKL